MNRAKDNLSKQERQNNIDSLIAHWKDRVHKIEDEGDLFLQSSEVQEALKKLKERRSHHGGIIPV
ncbi:hypothetical protein SAMN05216436_1219 [bacterium A37T11]|nr:hypothetical protein SAMN05216436_1219 [bacterium A37T11]